MGNKKIDSRLRGNDKERGVNDKERGGDDNGDKFDLITRNLEEILTEEDLKHLIESGTPMKHYIGFEISGKLHIGSGIISAMKIKDLQEAGVECNILLADWHTWINDKLGGNMEVIQKIAVGYFKEALRASMKCIGADPKKVNFILGSEFYHNNDKYWQSYIDICKNLTLKRVVKSSTIMGRAEGENQIFARLLYPPMQVDDIFSMGINIVHAGMDQRKAHVIAREVAKGLKINPLKDKGGHVIKPVALHHHLILGLLKPSKWPVEKAELRSMLSEMKMSKSKPDSAVFINDTPDEIRRKINKAFCPEGEVEFNPVLDWAKHLIFRWEEKEFIIERPEKWGGNIVVNSYEELEKKFAEKEVHPMDLKASVAEGIVELLEPARKHFSEDPAKGFLEEFTALYEKFQKDKRLR